MPVTYQTDRHVPANVKRLTFYALVLLIKALFLQVPICYKLPINA